MPTAGVSSLGQGLASYLGGKSIGAANAAGTHVDQLWALGLTGAVSNGVMKEAAATIGQ
jgi:hypothetical protein